MSESAAYDPDDVGFVRVITTKYRKQRKRKGQEKEVITKFQVREYDKDTKRGQFQLWVDDIYKENITSEIMERMSRKEHDVLAWLDDKPPELPKSDSAGCRDLWRRCGCSERGCRAQLLQA